MDTNNSSINRKPELSQSDISAICGDIASTVISIEDIAYGMMNIPIGEHEHEQDSAQLHAIITLAQKVGWLSDHMAAPQKGSTKGDVYEWMRVPRGVATSG